jgi:hypothetical protein
LLESGIIAFLEKLLFGMKVYFDLFQAVFSEIQNLIIELLQ